MIAIKVVVCQDRCPQSLRHLDNPAKFAGFFRTDYHLATPGVAALARREQIYLQQRFSDHAPLIIDYDMHC